MPFSIFRLQTLTARTCRLHARHGAVLRCSYADAVHAAGARLLAAEDRRRLPGGRRHGDHLGQRRRRRCEPGRRQAGARVRHGLFTVGLLWFTQVRRTARTAKDLFPGFLIVGLGMPFAFVPITIAALAGTSAAGGGPGVGPHQHVAADRWRGRHRDPVDDRRVDDELCREIAGNRSRARSPRGSRPPSGPAPQSPSSGCSYRSSSCARVISSSRRRRSASLRSRAPNRASRASAEPSGAPQGCRPRDRRPRAAPAATPATRPRRAPRGRARPVHGRRRDRWCRHPQRARAQGGAARAVSSPPFPCRPRWAVAPPSPFGPSAERIPPPLPVRPPAPTPARRCPRRHLRASGTTRSVACARPAAIPHRRTRRPGLPTRRPRARAEPVLADDCETRHAHDPGRVRSGPAAHAREQPVAALEPPQLARVSSGTTASSGRGTIGARVPSTSSSSAASGGSAASARRASGICTPP